MKNSSSTSMGIAIIVPSVFLCFLSILGLLPVFADKSVLLHFPALVISLFLIGTGLALTSRK